MRVAQKGRSGYMTLWYGSPVRVLVSGSYTYGATRWSATDVALQGTADGVSNLTKYFIIGYASCASGSQFMNVGAGISNCIIGAASDPQCTTSASYKTSAWVQGHGQAFALMVNGIGQWITDNGYGSRAAARAAWDMEPAWSSTSRAENWMHGYDGSNSYTTIANYSADGCPSTRIYNSTSNGGFDGHPMDAN